MADAQRRSTRSSADPQTQIRAVAGQFQWSSTTSPRTARPSCTPSYIPLSKRRRRDERAGRPDGPAVAASSNDVIHAFYVPQFLFKRDVVPGRINQFDFKVDATDAGQTFRGQCAELCGVGPQHHAVRRQGADRRPTSTPGWPSKVAEANAAAAGPERRPPSGSAGPAPSGAPAPARGRPDASTLDRQEHRRSTRRPSTAPADTAVQDRLRQPGRRRRPTTSRSTRTRRRARRSSRARSSPGVATKTYDVPALPAGTYTFVCTVHPNDDRHAHGPVRSLDGDDHADASRHRLPERACTTG